VKANGKGNPPLPLTQFISCGHAIKHVCPWILDFFLEFRKYSVRKVWKIEIDFSWVLIHSVLLVVNKESLTDYLTSMQLAEVLINCFPETPRGIISLSNTQEKSDRKRIEIGTSILTAKDALVL